MKSDEVFREVFKRHGVKVIAGKLKLSEPYLYKWTHPDGGKAAGGWNPLERLLSLIRVTGDLKPLNWLCQQCGGYFVPNPPAQPLAPAELLPATGGVMRELALLQAELAAAVRDCDVSPAEAAAMRQKWEGLKADMEAYLRQCEGKVFRPQPGPVRQAPPDARENL